MSVIVFYNLSKTVVKYDDEYTNILVLSMKWCDKLIRYSLKV